MIRIFFLILIFVLTKSIILKGQNELENPSSYTIKPQYGLILAHSKKVAHLTNTNPIGTELEYSKFMLKDKNWRQCNCYSKTGISFLYVNYNNPDIVGSSYNLIGFAEPVFIHSSHFLFSARMGIGVSYLDHVYDEIDNPENTFFSTSISFIAHLDLNTYYLLNDRYAFMLFAKYNHISNGGIKQPNYGMNFPMFGVGLSYHPSGKIEFPEREKTTFVSDFFFKIYLFGMIKKISADENYEEKNTIVSGIYGLTGKTISKINGFSIGAEYLYDGAANEKIYRKNLAVDHQQVSGLIGHHLLFGKFDFSQHWGIYVYAPYRTEYFYQRYSLSYKLSKFISGGVTLKAHGDIADSFNILIGVSL